jgi:hypothetical protein
MLLVVLTSLRENVAFKVCSTFMISVQLQNVCLKFPSCTVKENVLRELSLFNDPTRIFVQLDFCSSDLYLSDGFLFFNSLPSENLSASKNI